jgi:hypothetical protein
MDGQKSERMIGVEFPDVIYTGPAIDDPALLDELPADLVALLNERNGFVAYRGGLHLRGACNAPTWHSLRAAWRGPGSFAARYPAVAAGDIPIGEDVLGDQFLLRDGLMARLHAEVGEVEPMGIALGAFLDNLRADPIRTLALYPLMQFEGEGERLQPGQLLSAFPPVCTEEARDGVMLRAVPVAERLTFLAGLSAQLSGVPQGGRVTFKLNLP